MINKEKKICYSELIVKLDSLDIQLCRVKEQVTAIRELLQAPPESGERIDLQHIPREVTDE